MKFLTAFTLAIASLTTANPIEPRGMTNFDQYTGARLNLVSASFGPNRGLYYKGIGLAQIFDKGQNLQAVKAQSNPNVLTYGDLDRLSDPYPYITSIYPGSNGTFALQSVYVGCVLGNIPGACTISIVGFKNGVKVASTAVTYQPVPGTIPSAMTKVTFPRVSAASTRSASSPTSSTEQSTPAWEVPPSWMIFSISISLPLPLLPPPLFPPLH
ncbi:hypothetical protein G7054_g6693 [Neopestalotiopsis clavispora]|nr:hypothetical protein G7054_g6693 [Neopestalotiopsis clavispora]